MAVVSFESCKVNEMRKYVVRVLLSNLKQNQVMNLLQLIEYISGSYFSTKGVVKVRLAAN